MNLFPPTSWLPLASSSLTTRWFSSLSSVRIVTCTTLDDFSFSLLRGGDKRLEKFSR
jgi:hypothetical protein